MSETIFDELLATTKIKPRNSESPQDLAKRLVNAVDKLDDDAWGELSGETQTWVNDGIKAVEAGTAILLPPGMEDQSEPAEEEEAEEPEELEEPEPEDAEEPAPEDEEGEEEMVATVPNGRGKTKTPAKKRAAKKTATKKKAPVKKAASKKTSAKKAARVDGAKFVSKLGLRGKYAQMEEAACAGKLPPVPDFRAETHKPWRSKLDEVVKMARAGDVKGLKKYSIVPRSTSPKVIDRYRKLAIVALEARS